MLTCYLNNEHYKSTSKTSSPGSYHRFDLGHQFHRSLYRIKEFSSLFVKRTSVWPFGPAMGVFYAKAQRLSEVDCILWSL